MQPQSNTSTELEASVTQYEAQHYERLSEELHPWLDCTPPSPGQKWMKDILCVLTFFVMHNADM